MSDESELFDSMSNAPISADLMRGDLDATLKTMEPKRALDLSAIARTLNACGKDPVWLFMQAMEIHTRQLEQIPTAITAGAKSIEAAGQKASGLIKSDIDALTNRLSQSKNEIETAAQSGAINAVQSALKELDANKIVSDISQKVGATVAAKITEQQKGYWRATGQAFIAVALTAAITVAGVAGLYLHAAIGDGSASQLIANAACGQPGRDGVRVCTFRAR